MFARPVRLFDATRGDPKGGIECSWCRATVSETTQEMCLPCYGNRFSNIYYKLIEWRNARKSSLKCTDCGERFSELESTNGYFHSTIYGARHIGCCITMSQAEKYGTEVPMSIKQHDIFELRSTGGLESMLAATLAELVKVHHQQIIDHVESYMESNSSIYEDYMRSNILHVIERVRPNGTVGQVHKDIIQFFEPVFKQIDLYDLLNKESGDESG